MGRTRYVTLLLSVHLILAVCAVLIVSPAVTEDTGQADPIGDGRTVGQPEMSMQTITETTGANGPRTLWEAPFDQQGRLNLSFAQREGHQRVRGNGRPPDGQIRYMRGFAP